MAKETESKKPETTAGPKEKEGQDQKTTGAKVLCPNCHNAMMQVGAFFKCNTCGEAIVTE